MDKGLHVSPDDLTVGNYYAVVGCKKHNKPISIAGMAFQATAINMPFMVGKMVCDSNLPPITLDLRFLNLMNVDENFVKAQTHNVQQSMIPQSFLEIFKQKLQ